MHTVLIIVMSLAAYGTGAVLARRALRALSFGVHPLEAIQMIALLPMLLLLRRPEYSVGYYLMIAAAVCVIGATMACAALLTDGSPSGEASNDAGFPMNMFRAIWNYEIRLARASWHLIDQLAVLRVSAH